MKSDADILRAAKALIATPKTWVQGQARIVDNDGITTHRCAMSACRSLSFLNEGPTPMRPVQLLRQAGYELHPDREIEWINDRFGHAAVMAVYDRAIELAEGESK